MLSMGIGVTACESNDEHASTVNHSIAYLHSLSRNYTVIIGEDIYAAQRSYGPQTAKFMEVLDYTAANKIIALTENGCIPDTDLLVRDGVMWAWWCTWEGEFVLKTKGFNAYSDRYTEKAMVKKIYQHERVITRKNLPDIRSYPLDGE